MTYMGTAWIQIVKRRCAHGIEVFRPEWSPSFEKSYLEIACLLLLRRVVDLGRDEAL